MNDLGTAIVLRDCDGVPLFFGDQTIEFTFCVLFFAHTSHQLILLMNLKEIGNYKIGKPIGEGTFGQVRLGEHKLTQEVVAIKILEKSKMKEQTDFERISREINILRKLRHPNIIQIYEVLK